MLAAFTRGIDAGPGGVSFARIRGAETAIATASAGRLSERCTRARERRFAGPGSKGPDYTPIGERQVFESK
jgi:hypothetical protein